MIFCASPGLNPGKQSDYENVWEFQTEFQTRTETVTERTSKGFFNVHDSLMSGGYCSRRDDYMDDCEHVLNVKGTCVELVAMEVDECLMRVVAMEDVDECSMRVVVVALDDVEQCPMRRVAVVVALDDVDERSMPLLHALSFQFHFGSLPDRPIH